MASGSGLGKVRPGPGEGRWCRVSPPTPMKLPSLLCAGFCLTSSLLAAAPPPPSPSPAAEAKMPTWEEEKARGYLPYHQLTVEISR